MSSDRFILPLLAVVSEANNDNTAGLDFVIMGVRATMAQKNLEFWRDFIFRDVPSSWTAEVRILNQRVIFTADPENIKAVLATQFADYGKGEIFHKDFEPFLGDSIFATDGHKWQTSRQLIRPQFTKDRVSDLHCFESHMQTLFKTIANGGPLSGEDQPVDMTSGQGRILDISDLFFRYTLDVTTEFLLGTDIKSLR
jgi:cytochrome P450